MGSYLAHGSKIYHKAHENPRAFSCISGPIFLESSIQCPWGLGLHHFCTLFLKTNVNTLSCFCSRPMDINHLHFDFIHITDKWHPQKSDKFSVSNKREVLKPNHLYVSFFLFLCLKFEFKVRTKTKEWTKVYFTKVAFNMGQDNNNCLYFANNYLYFDFYFSNQSAQHGFATRYETIVMSRKKAQIPQQILQWSL